MNPQVLFVLKIIISSLLIAGASSLAGKKPLLAGFLIALPLTSILGLCWSYVEYRDMEKINQFAVSIVVAVPLSLLFFLPFFLNRWLKLSFIPTMIFGLGLLYVAYLIHHFFFMSKQS